MLNEEFLRGLEQFNRHEFYACHDTLEALWMESAEPHKTFYQGILQVAVACYHLGNKNLRGAMILLGEGARRLHSYQPDYEGVDVSILMEESLTLLQFLQQASPLEVETLVELLGSGSALESSYTATVPPLPKIVLGDEYKEGEQRLE
ncbi:MAG: hypothetical protein N5P05_001708 [Chroococcopsis gigantea SAG 12.99]|jgi:predicted metal-dependent hydrolase|nr:DUF309 domain-containing protein [Chlorogloea purpurea SAG 13.99]MDV3000102.1 hypothetical protein [Chroococcopsis gigantea SAG 12.99]